MSVGTFLKTTKGKIITGAGGTVVAVGIGVAVLMQGGGYRSIAVEQLSGSVNVVGEKNNGQAYEGQHLYSGDDVTVGDASELTMCMDNDKYVYADANTHFKLEASDASEDSMIKIYLDAGSELNELNSKLAEGESYEVDTPNSTMSVRGTRFRVTVYKAKDGLIYTLTEVESGQVLIRLKTTDGSYNGVEKLFTAGQSALIRGNSDFSEFVSGDLLDAGDLENQDADSALKLAYDNLPEDGLERLIALLDGEKDGKDKKTPDNKTVKDNSKKTEKDKKKTEEVAEATAERETSDNRSFYTIIVEPSIASRNEDGTITLTDGVLFDPDYYARTYPDVVKNFGSDDDALLAHWLIFGQNENRFPNEAAEKERLAQWLAFEEEQKVTPESDSSSGSGGSKTTVTYIQSVTVIAGRLVNPATGNAIASTTNNGTIPHFDTGVQESASIMLPLTLTDATGASTTITSLSQFNWRGSGYTNDNTITVTDGSNVVSILYDTSGNQYCTVVGTDSQGNAVNWDSRISSSPTAMFADLATVVSTL